MEPSPPGLVSPSSFNFMEHRARAAEVIFNHLQLARGKIGCIPSPSLLHPYPCAQHETPHDSHTPHDRTWTGCPCHPHALRRGHTNHCAAARVMAVGARPWLERRRLILQPIQPPPTLGTMPNTPYLALTLELLHVSLRTWTGLALAADADGRTTFCRPAAREKAAGSARPPSSGGRCRPKDALSRAS